MESGPLPSLTRGPSRKRGPEGSSDSPPEKRSRPDGPPRLRVRKMIDFLNPKAMRESMYLYPTRGSSLPKYPSHPDKKGKSILENDEFMQDWFPMSLPVKDHRWLVDHYYTGYLCSKAELFDAKVGLLNAFYRSKFGQPFFIL